MFKKGIFAAAGAALFAAVTAFAVADSAPSTDELGVVGYLYTSLNGEGTNQVIAFERLEDGSLGRQMAYSTGSLGGANRAAGGDAAGDFDSQGAIQIIENHMLVVNAGGNTITVFELDRATGGLSRKANVSSGGTRPVSLAFVPKSAGAGQYWVVAGNQWNNPNVQKGGEGEGPIELYPDAAFHADGGGHEQVLEDRNIFLFSFDARTGALSPERRLDAYPGTNVGPRPSRSTRAGRSSRWPRGGSPTSPLPRRRARSRAVSTCTTSIGRPERRAVSAISKRKASREASGSVGTCAPRISTYRTSTSWKASATTV